jgi:hypothetical protein
LAMVRSVGCRASVGLSIGVGRLGLAGVMGGG